MITPNLKRGLKELDKAQPAYDKAYRYFEGEMHEVLEHFSPSVYRRVAATGKSYRFRLARKPVTALANRVKVSSVTVPEDDAATERIEEIREANDMVGVWEPMLLRRTFEYGDSYFMVWPVDEPDADPIDQPGDYADEYDEDLIKAGVEIIYYPPTKVRAIYDTETERRCLYVINRWCEVDENGEEITRVDLWYPDRIERFFSKDQMDTSQEVTWHPYVDEQSGDDGIIENPFGKLPWFHFRTDMPYGRALHADAYGPQDGINKLLITMLTAVDSAGWPDRVALTDPEAALNENADDPDWDDDEFAVSSAGAGGDVRPGGQSSSMRTGPGIMRTLEGIKDVKEFTAVQTDNLVNPVETLIKLMAVATDTPLHELDPSGDPPSGKALRTARAPLDAKQESIEALLKGPFRSMWKFALEIVGITVPKVVVEFEAPPQVEDSEEWDVSEKKQTLGVPTATTLLERGYTPDQVEEWLPENDDQQDDEHRIDLLGKMATAISSLSSGVSSGLVDKAVAAGVIAAIMKRVLGEEDPLDITPPEPPMNPAQKAIAAGLTGKEVGPDGKPLVEKKASKTDTKSGKPTPADMPQRRTAPGKGKVNSK